MKKLLFSLIGTVILSFSGNAQKMSESAQQAAVNAQVVTFVNVSKAFYTRGQSFEGFIESLTIPSPTVPSQEEFLRKVYSYVSNNTPDCEIMEADNSEFKSFVIDLSQSERNQGDPSTMGKKKWWQILINVAINVAIDVLIPGNDIDNVDLFP